MRILLSLLMLIFVHTNLIGQSAEEILNEANASYRRGEEARTLLERETAFNLALRLYLELADLSVNPSSQLNQAIANSYDQLGEYAWSILYNERALQLEPRNGQIFSSIKRAKEKLGLPSSDEPFSFWDKLLLNSILSLGERFETFFWLFLLTVCFLSLTIWRNCCQIASTILSTLSFVLLFNIMVDFYFSPIQGVLINSTGYYREPDIKQPQLTALPLRAGTKIRILSAYSQGSWLKVVDSNELVGYIPTASIRII